MEEVGEGGEDQSGGRTSRVLWWQRPNEDKDQFLWCMLAMWWLASKQQVQDQVHMENAAHEHCLTTFTGQKEQSVGHE